MTLDIFSPDRSDRAERLYMAVKPYVTHSSSILDIGCGTAPLAGYISKKHPGIHYEGFDNNGSVIAELNTAYGGEGYVFKRLHYEPGNVESYVSKAYDIIIHIGIDSYRWTPIHFIHKEMLASSHLHPHTILLETGYAPQYPYCLHSYNFVKGYYGNYNYKLADEGVFSFDVNNHHLRQRHWCVITK